MRKLVVWSVSMGILMTSYHISWGLDKVSSIIAHAGPAINDVVVVNNVRHLYTEWEENPGKIILRSKSSVTMLPAPSLSSAQDKHDYEGEGTSERGAIHGAGEKAPHRTQEKDRGTCEKEKAEKGTGEGRVESTVALTDSGFISVLDSSVSGGSGLDDDDTDGSHSYKHSHTLARCGLQGSKATRSKYSPEQLKTIQARVKDSLKNQGVYLYDPVTGAGERTSLVCASLLPC